MAFNEEALGPPREGKGCACRFVMRDGWLKLLPESECGYHRALRSSPPEALSEEWTRDYKTLYLELLMSVGNKYPGETRHQTAKRYILQAESANSGEAQQASSSAPDA